MATESPEASITPGWTARPMAGPPADKGDSAIHDNQIGTNRNVHLGRTLGNKHVVITVHSKSVKKMDHPDNELKAHGKPGQKMCFHCGGDI